MYISEKDTFDSKGNSSLFEIIEWDDLWFQNANDEKNTKRILLIGDSISRAYRWFLNNMYEGEAYIDQLSTSKALDNKAFKALIDYTLMQLDRPYEAIVFNNAAHGFHLNDAEYEKYYRELIAHIINKSPQSKVIISLGVPVRDADDLTKMNERWYEKMLGRNAAAKAIAKEFNLPVNDLYSVVENRPDVYYIDGVHFNDDGNAALAEKTYATLKELGI